MNVKRSLILGFSIFSVCGCVLAAPLQSIELFVPGKERARITFFKADNSLIRSVSAEKAELFVNREEAPKDAACFLCQVMPWRELPEFTRADFVTSVFLPPDQPLRVYNLRLIDADSEVFQFRVTVPKGDGQWHDLRFHADAASPEAMHYDGGKKADGKITMPVRFVGVLGDFGDGNGRIGIGKMQCEILDSNAPLAPELLTGSGSDIHVLKKGEEKSLELLLRNPRARDLSGSLTWALTGVRGEALGNATEKVVLKPGEEKRLVLPAPAAFGVYKLQVEVTDDDPSVRKFQKEMRFAYLVPAGATAEFDDGFLFGVCAHPDRYLADDRRKEAMAAAWCGSKAIRSDLWWWLVEPVEGQWEFDLYDKIIALYKEYGIEFTPIYVSPPEWAVAKDWKPTGRYAYARWRPDYGYWRKYIETVTKRYRGQIRFVEIWSEPDLYMFGSFTEQEYVQMLEIAYDEVKKDAPELKVFCGGFTGIPGGAGKAGNPKTMQAVVRSGKYDIFAFHGHGPFSNYRYDIEHLPTWGNRKPWFPHETAVTAVIYGEEVQAQTLFRKLIFSWAKGAIGYTWYDLRNDGFDPTNGEHNYGLLTNDFYPKPAYAAYNTLANLYRGGKFLHEIPLGEDLYGCWFRGRDGELLLAAWSDSGDDRALPLAVSGIRGKVETVDLYGNAKPLAIENGAATFEVGQEPVTLRVTGQTREPGISGLLVRPAGELAILPGGDAEFAFELHNPETKERDYRIRLTLPAGLSTEAKTAKLRLAPGETKKISFPVRANENFRSLPDRPKELTLALGNRNFRYWVGSVIPVPPKGYREKPDIVLDNARQVHPVIPYSPENAHLFWKGPQDLSAKVWFGRDGDTLLLKAEVTDDVHTQPHSGRDAFLGDNIQLALMLPGQEGNWEFGFSRLDSGKSEALAKLAPRTFQKEAVTAKIALETSRDETAKLTRYEARIPVTAIGLTGKEGSNSFRFILLVNDNDGSKRESFLSVTPSGLNEKASRCPWVKF